jgi:alcohol dehydrogenase
MRALVYHGPGAKAWEDVPKPVITTDTDAIVRVDTTTICGTDLHILRGDVPIVSDGRILGHEAVGTVEEVGSGVKTVKAGDRVLVSCVSVCGTCRYCREGHPGQCLGGGGWIFGYKIDGTQAEYVRVPFADTSTYPVPPGAEDEDILMLADILPTGYEVGVLNGGVRPGDVVAVVGSGPVGLSAITGARLFSPSHIVAIDLADSRLEAAKQFGADITVNNDRRAGSGRGHRGGRGSGQLRAGRRAVAAGRPHRQHRRARRAGDPAPRGAMDQEHHDHYRAGGRLFHPDAAAFGDQPSD